MFPKEEKHTETAVAQPQVAFLGRFRRLAHLPGPFGADAKCADAPFVGISTRFFFTWEKHQKEAIRMSWWYDIHGIFTGSMANYMLEITHGRCVSKLRKIDHQELRNSMGKMMIFAIQFRGTFDDK